MVKKKETILQKICKLVVQLQSDARMSCLFVWKGPLQDHVIGTPGIKAKVTNLIFTFFAVTCNMDIDNNLTKGIKEGGINT